MTSGPQEAGSTRQLPVTPVTPNVPSALELRVLTGIRSSKPNFYQEYRHTSESMKRLLRSFEAIAVALASADQGPLDVCREVVTATGTQLGARWAVIAVRPGALPDTQVRLVARDPGGRIVVDGRCLPSHIRGRVQWAWSHARSTVLDGKEAFLPLVMGGLFLGVLGVLQDDISGGLLNVDQDDVRALTILANQAAASLHSDDVLRRNEHLLRETEQLYEQANAHARSLAVRNRQLQTAREKRGLPPEEPAVEAERRRLASELHDTVARQVLSAGITIERCRDQVAAGTVLHERLSGALGLIRLAVRQLRASIQALGPGSAEDDDDLPTMLRRIGERHTTKAFEVAVQVSGDHVAVPGPVKRALLLIASECLFNTAVHAHAQRAVVSLGYGGDWLRLAVADDGDGQPQAVRSIVRGEVPGTGGGYHRGLTDVAARVEDLHGRLEVDRSVLGGIQVEVRVPLAFIWGGHGADAQEVPHD
jgi:signal transduction histidine kinase